MKLLLAFMLGSVLLGLFTDQLDSRTNLLIIAGVVATTIVYYAFQRFMSI